MSMRDPYRRVLLALLDVAALGFAFYGGTRGVAWCILPALLLLSSAVYFWLTAEGKVKAPKRRC